MKEPKLAVVYYKDSLNIGDDIQTYAAARLLPKVDYYLDRESLHNPPTDEKIKLICSGWFMKKPENWPPAPNIEPLFISMHIDYKNNVHKYMLSDDLIDYYKKYEPIGCRDWYTVNLFKKAGVDAYFSGCLTLTLESEETQKTNDVYLVEPFTKFFLKHYINYNLRRLIPKEEEQHVKYVSHYPINLKKDSIEHRLDAAKKLVDQYAKARLVITSRIHCALPCLALGTPVYFTEVGYNRKHAKNRFKGLGEFFKIIDDSYFPLTNNQPWGKLMRFFYLYRLISRKKSIPIDWNPPKTIKKSEDLQKTINELKRRVDEFIKK